LKKFDVLEIPNETKLSYFFKPKFLNSILEYLLDVSERISKDKPVRTINEEIKILKTSPIEFFLDIVSIEFNKHDVSELRYDDDPEKDNINEDLENNNTIVNESLFQVNILNKFLTQIDVEIICSWANGIIGIEDNENYDIHNISKHLFKNAKTFISNIHNSDNLNNSENSDKHNERSINNFRSKEIMKYEKKMIKDEFNIEKKIPSEIYNLELVDLLDLIDQLYLFLSIIFCIGILGKREAWGKTQISFLEEPHKSILNKWCNLEIQDNYLECETNEVNINRNINKLEDIKSPISFNLRSTSLSNLGWMNISGNTNNTTDNKFYKEFEILKIENKELLGMNKELSNYKELNEINNTSLLRILSNLDKEIETNNFKKNNEIDNLKKDHQNVVNKFENEIKNLNDTIKQLKQEIIFNNNKSKEENKIEFNHKNQIREQEINNNELKNFEINEYDRIISELNIKIDIKDLEINDLKNNLNNYGKTFDEFIEKFNEFKGKFRINSLIRANELENILIQVENLEQNMKYNQCKEIINENNHEITYVNNFQELMNEINLNKNESKLIEFKIRIGPNNKIEFINNNGKIIKVDENSLLNGKQILIKFNLEFLFNLLLEKENIGEIREVYKTVLIEQLNKYILLKRCCKILRERNLEFINKFDILIKKDEEVWKWFEIMKKRVKKIEERIEEILFSIIENRCQDKNEIIVELYEIRRNILSCLNQEMIPREEVLINSNKNNGTNSRIVSEETRLEV
jgi:hypothetical protein